MPLFHWEIYCVVFWPIIFEPYMKSNRFGQEIFTILTGKGNGSGLALMYIFLGIVGFVGSLLFKKNKNFQKLDEE